MTIDLEIVTHCYSGHPPGIYHNLLHYQLSSIVNNPLSSGNVQVTVYCTPVDKKTTDVIAQFLYRYDFPENVRIVARPTLPSRLFRRAWGRNEAAKLTRADTIWFTDCDYLVGPHCLDSMLHASRESKASLIYPKVVNINREHSLGDEAIQRSQDIIDQTENSANMPIVDFDVDDFMPRAEKNAWGGMFVVRGSTARRDGYLDGTKWAEPLENVDGGFKQCKCDVPYRKSFGTKESREDIVNVFRMRHSRAGRDGGQKDHSK